MANITYSGSRSRLLNMLRQIPAICRGESRVRAGHNFQLRLGMALLTQIHLDFIIKSRGGRGRDYIKWEPLKPATIARRKRTRVDIRAARQQIAAALASGSRRPTVVELYGNRIVDIGRDTSRLFRSLSPGVDVRPANPDQILESHPGRVVVGTNVIYAGRFHAGYWPKNVPARPLWPLDGVIPAAWWDAIEQVAATGIEKMIQDIVRSNSSS